MTKIVWIATLLATFIIIVGIFIPFIELDGTVEIKNDGYVGALFSLSGVLLYFAALMYQIKEYKLQVIELKKSVEAQTKSSEELEAQKRILLEQNSNSFIFGMIESFNAFKKRNETDKAISEIITYYLQLFAISWQEISRNNALNNKEKNIEFANRIKDLFENSIIGQDNYHSLKDYIQFAYNILSLIDSNEIYLTRNNFKPFFFNQLNTNENIIIHLSNLSSSNLPYYGNLTWDYYTTKVMISLIENNKMTHVNTVEIDCELLTRKFNELRQQNKPSA